MQKLTNPGRLSAQRSEAALRHEIRNLRAKVRALLPIEICSKYDHRNRKVIALQQARDAMLGMDEKQELKKNINGGKFGAGTAEIKLREEEESDRDIRKVWSMKRIQSKAETSWMKERPRRKIAIEKFYCEETRKREQEHLFKKLSGSEIDRINEDRLYFLGEKHIPAFENFLAFGNSKPDPRPAPKEISSGRKQLLVIKPPAQSLHEMKADLLKRGKSRQDDYQERKKMLDEYQSCRISDLQSKLYRREEIVKENLRMMKSQSMASLRERNLAETQKYMSAKNRRQKHQNFGELVYLSEKLRRICFRKGNKEQKLDG